jgi:hypothetical protein
MDQFVQCPFSIILANQTKKNSKILQASSEKVQHIILGEEVIVAIDSYGTSICQFSTQLEIGNLPYLIQNPFLLNYEFFFVATVQNISSFKNYHSLPSKIACSSGKSILTTSGILMNFDYPYSNQISPKPQFVEYAVDTLHQISDDGIKLKEDIQSQKFAFYLAIHLSTSIKSSFDENKSNS